MDIIDLRAILTTMIVSTALGGCGRSADNPARADTPAASKVDVSVTFDGKRRKCVIALSSEAQGSVVACDEVVPFIRDELRLSSGARYDLRTTSDVDQAEIGKIRASLDGSGYRFAGGSEIDR